VGRAQVWYEVALGMANYTYRMEFSG